MPGRFIPAVGIDYADKAVHFTMYGVFGFLAARAMHRPPRTTRLRVFLAAFLLVVAIGALDEWHQTYIQGRSTELLDWLADSSGGLVAALAWAMVTRSRSNSALND